MDRSRTFKVLFVLLIVSVLILGVFVLVLTRKDAALIWEDAMWMMSDKSINRFSVTDQAIKNPLMGFAPAATSRSNVSDNSLVYVDVTFRELEPEEGVYAFGQIEKDNHLEQWRREGKHVVLRFICDRPEDKDHIDIPDWLYERIKGDGDRYDVSYGKGFSPDYDNTTFIEYHAKAIGALGRYFGSDNFVSYIQLGSLGHWGEWHVKYSDGIERLPPADVRLKYILPYIEAFPHAKLMMRRPFAAAEEYGFGLYNDMVGNPESTKIWMDWIENGGDYEQAKEEDALVPMKDSWKTAPIGGEFTSSFAMDWIVKVNIEETVKMIAYSHTTFLGPKFPKPSNATDDLLLEKGIQKILNSMGYRYAVTKAEINRSWFLPKTKVSLTWTNGGVAPMYFDWPVYIYVLDGQNNQLDRYPIDLALTKLLPGKTAVVSTVYDHTRYEGKQIKLCVGIEDPMTNAPAVLLTCDNERIGALSVIWQQP